MIRDTTKRIKKIMNKILAICVATPATPLNPKIPAMMAIIKKIAAQTNINTPGTIYPSDKSLIGSRQCYFKFALAISSPESVIGSYA